MKVIFIVKDGLDMKKFRKGKLTRRIISTLLSVAMILSMLSITIITADAAGTTADIKIKDVTKKYSLAADIFEGINSRRQAAGLSLLKLDRNITDEAMERAAELPIKTEQSDLMNRFYGYDDTNGNKYYEAVLKSTNSAETILDSLFTNTETTAVKAASVYEMGVGVITVNNDDNNVFVCVRLTNEKTVNESLVEITAQTLRDTPDETENVRREALLSNLNIQSVSSYNNMYLEQGEIQQLLYKAKNTENNCYAYIIPDLTVSPSGIVRADDEGNITALSCGTATVTMALLCDDGDPYYNEVKVNVYGKEFTECTFNYKNKWTRTGSGIEPPLTITDENNSVLTLGQDYTLTYKNNINTGTTAQITVNGLGEYFGRTKILLFTIVAAPSVDVNLSAIGAYPGEKVTVDMTGHGGIEPYSYSLKYAGPDGVEHQMTMNNGEYSLSPVVNGVYSITGTVTDSDGVSQYTTKTLTVTDPMTLSFADASYAGDKDQYVSVHLNQSGGLAPITYTFSYEDGTSIGTSSTSSYSFKVTKVGTFNIIATATDAAGHTEQANASLTGIGPLTAGVTLSSNMMYTGAYVTITGKATGGYAPITYDFYEGGNKIPSQGDVCSFTKNEEGEYTVTVTATDSKGTTSSINCPVSVKNQPVISLSAPKTELVVGDSVRIDASVEGGFSPYSYSYRCVETGVTGRNSYYVFRADTEGTYTIEYTASDSLGGEATAEIVLEVSAKPTVTIEPSQAKAYTNEAVTFTASAQGGYSGGSYSFLLDGETVPSSGNTATMTIGTKGSHKIKVIYTDRNGNTANKEISYSVALPFTLTASTTTPEIIVGKSVTIKAVGSNGFGSTYKYTYAFKNGDVIKDISTSTSVSFTPSEPGNYIVVVTGTDSYGTAQQEVSVTAASAPQVTLDSSADQVYTNQSITFTANGSGGFGNGTYVFKLGSTVLESTGNTVTFVPQSTGSLTVTVTYTDRNGNSASASKKFNSANPLSVGLSADKDHILKGGSSALTAVVTGGMGTVSKKYTSADGTQLSTGSTYTYKPTAAGQETIYFTASDSMGTTITKSITIYTAEKIVISDMSADNSYIILGNSSNIEAQASGGFGTLNYKFTLADGTELASNGNKTKFTPAETGSYTIKVVVTDIYNNSASKTVTVSAANALSVTLDSDQVEVLSGSKLLLTTTASDGFPSYTYSYKYSDGTAISGTNASNNVTINRPAGNYTIIASVRDKSGNTVSAQKNIVVADKLNLTTTVSSEAIFRGESADITAELTGGFAPYTYSFSYDDGSVITGPSQNTAVISPDQNGEYVVNITASDRKGNTVTANKTIKVADRLLFEVNASATEVYVNNEVTFTFSSEGGFEPISYSYTCTNSGSMTKSGNTYIFKPTKAGTYSIVITAKDAYDHRVDIPYEIVATTPITLDLSLSSSAVQKGVPFTVEAISTGGFEPISYEFEFENGQNIVSSGNTAALQLDRAGDYVINAAAEDKNGNIANASVTVSIYEPLEMGLEASSLTPLTGTKVTFTASSTGGYGTVTYKYTVNGSSLSSTNGVANYTPASAGEYIVVATATDKAGKTVSAQKTVTAASKITLTAASSDTKIMLGESLTLNASASGGFAPLSYRFEYPDGTEIPSSGNEVTFTPDRSGSLAFRIIVTDDKGNTAETSKSVTVTEPLSVDLTAPRTELIKGDSVTLTANASGGFSTTYYYSYRFADGTEIAGTSKTLSFSTSSRDPGSYTIIVTVKDTKDHRVEDQITITVKDKMTVSADLSDNAVYLGDTITLSVNAAGGYAPYTYSYEYTDGTAISGSGNTVDLSRNDPGDHTVKVKVFDKNNNSTEMRVTFTVTSEMSAELGVSSDRVTKGTKVTLTTSVNGGFAPYTYSYSYADGTEITGTSSSTSVTMNETGTFTVRVTVTDSTGDIKTSGSVITVADKVTAEISGAGSYVYLNEPMILSSAVSGGFGNYTYEFKLSNGTVISESAQAEYTAQTTGSKKITLTVKDELGNKATAEKTITAAQRPEVTLSSSVDDVIVGTGVRFTAAATGGASTLTYQFEYENGTVITSGTTNSVSVTPKAAGRCKVIVKVTDKAGTTVSASKTVNVADKITASLSSASDYVYIGESMYLNASANGGIGELSYQIKLDDGTIISDSGTSAVYSPEVSGTKKITLTVSDSKGNTASASKTVYSAEKPAVELTASADEAAPNTKITLTANLTGGFSPIAYSFDAPDGVTLSVNKNVASATLASTGSYAFTVTAADKSGYTVTAHKTVRIVSDLSVSLEVSDDEVYTGDNIVFTATAQKGKSPYKYSFYYRKGSAAAWTLRGTEFGTENTITLNPVTATNYDVMVKVKDAAGTVVSANIRTNVNQALTNESTVSASKVKVGENVTLDAVAYGGKLPYKYAFYFRKANETEWKVKGTEFGTASQAVLTPGTAAKYEVRIAVKDSADRVEEQTFNIESESVYRNESTVNRTAVIIGQSVTITGAASGGQEPYSYAFYFRKGNETEWKVKGTEFGSDTTATLMPGSEATYEVLIKVKDAAGAIRTKGFSIESSSEASSLVNCSRVSASSVKIGNSVTVTGAAEGGKAPYKYAFYYRKGDTTNWTLKGTEYGTDNSVTLKPGTITNYEVMVKIKDSAGTVRTKIMSIEVNENPFTNLSTVSSTNARTGDTVTIRGAAEGGKAPYKYAFYYRKGDASNWTVKGTEYGTASTAQLNPVTATKYEVMVKIKDASGTVKTKIITINVTENESTLVNRSTVSAENARIYDFVKITGAAEGGNAPYRYSFYYKKGNASSWTLKGTEFGTASSVTLNPATATEYEIMVMVKDASGTIRTKTMVVTVSGNTAEIVNNSTVSATSAKIGDTITITGSATGGKSPYSYAFYYKKGNDTDWTLKGTEFGSENTAVLRPGTATGYQILVKIRDAQGNMSQKLMTVTVK